MGYGEVVVMVERKAGTPGRDLYPLASGSRILTWLALVLTAVGTTIVVNPARAMALVHESIVVDAATGRVLEAHNADAETYPASLTKLMTLYLTFAALTHGKLGLDQPLPVSIHAAAQSPTKLGLRPGRTISVRSAILGIVTRSANDAAVVLGEALGGNETNFARMMTTQARELGMTRTQFENASGLPNPGQKTTARDMAMLALALIHTFPQYYHFFSVREFNFRGRIIPGHDHLLGNYPGCDGMKTGFIRASGYNLVSSAARDGHRVVGVVLGGETYARRDREMRHLLNAAFAGERAPAVPVPLASTMELAPAPVEADHRMVERQELARPTVKAERVRDVAAAPAERHEVVARGSSDFSIRIGGPFRTIRHARWAMHSAIRTAPRELHRARFKLIREARRGRRRYIVQVTDLSEWRAQKACRKLRSRRFDCEVREPISARSPSESGDG